MTRSYNTPLPVDIVSSIAIAISSLPALSASVTQGTSPWVISGAVSVSNFPATQPVSGTVSIGNFPATTAVTQSTSPWVTSGTVTANQGTAGVSAWKVDGTGGTFPISGSISNTSFDATQGTSPWVVSGSVTASGTVTANAGTNLNTSGLAVESGGNLATLAGAITSSKMQIRALTSADVVTVQQSAASSLKVDLSGTAANGTAIKVDGTGGSFPISGSISNTTFAATQSGVWTTQQKVLSQASSAGTPITSATDTLIVAAPSANTHLRIHRLQAANSGATSTWAYWRDGVTGTKLFPVFLPTNGFISIIVGGSWDLTGTATPKALYLTTSAAGNVEWHVEYETVAD